MDITSIHMEICKVGQTQNSSSTESIL